MYIMYIYIYTYGGCVVELFVATYNVQWFEKNSSRKRSSWSGWQYWAVAIVKWALYILLLVQCRNKKLFNNHIFNQVYVCVCSFPKLQTENWNNQRAKRKKIEKTNYKLKKEKKKRLQYWFLFLQICGLIVSRFKFHND